MINEEKKRVFEYLGWKICLEEKDRLVKYCSYVDTCYSCPIYHPLDGNDIVSAINKMVEKGDLKDFLQFSWQHKTPDNRNTLFNYIHSVIGNPENFFQLMAKFLGG